MRELMNSVVRFSTTMTLFGFRQFQTSVMVVTEWLKWGYYGGGLTCPDCGAQREFTKEFRRSFEEAMRSRGNGFVQSLGGPVTEVSVEQFRNTSLLLLSMSRWFYGGMTCPDCGHQQELAKVIRHSMDAVTKALHSQLQEDNKQSLDSLSRLGSDWVDRAGNVLSGSAVDPWEILSASEKLVRRTSDALTDWARGAAVSPNAPEARPEEFRTGT